MKAIVIVPDPDPRLPAFLTVEAQLIDRPFVRHVVEFIADQNIRSIDIVGTDPRSLEHILSDGSRWGAAIRYHASMPDAVFKTVAELAQEEDYVLLARADSLPILALSTLVSDPSGTLIFSSNDGDHWTGWAVISGAHARSISPIACEAEVAGYLEGLGLARTFAEREFRCLNEKLLWQAHYDALAAAFEGIFVTGRMVRPGLWRGRNAWIHPSVTINPPVYVGENSRIGEAASLGPFTVVARDCLVSARTTIQHSVVGQGTYVGSDLELDHMMAHKTSLFDVRSEVALRQIDETLLDGLFDFSLKDCLLRFAGRVSATLILLVAALPLALYSLWWSVVRGRAPWSGRNVLRTPAPQDPSHWTTTRVWTFRHWSNTSEMRSLLSRIWFVWLPSLVSVLQGDIDFWGDRPLTVEEAIAIPVRRRNSYLSSRAGASAWLSLDHSIDSVADGLDPQVNGVQLSSQSD